MGSVSNIFCLSPVDAARGLQPQQLGGAGMMGADSLAKEMKEARRLFNKTPWHTFGLCDLLENGMLSIWTLGLKVEKLWFSQGT